MICKQCATQHKQAARRIFWHGTSSNHLRSILKQGLLPDKTKAVYDKELDNNIGGTRSIKTYGGVYLTEDFRTAYMASGTASRKTDSKRLIVAVTYEERTPGTLIDEDSIIINMSYLGQSGTRRSDDLFRGSGFWPNNVGLYEYKSYYSSVSFDVARIPEIVDFINNADLTEYSKMFIDKLTADWPKLQKRYDAQSHKMERLVSHMLKCYAYHLMEVELKPKLTEVKNGIVKNLAELETYTYSEEQKQQQRDKYEATLNTLDHLPPELTSTWSKLRDAVDMLSAFAKELTERPGSATDEHRFDHIRAKETISFSGKNRILFIAEIDEHRNEDGFVSEVVVHWGKEHLKLFEDKYSQAWGPKFKVVDKHGTILKNSAKEEIGK